MGRPQELQSANMSRRFLQRAWPCGYFDLGRNGQLPYGMWNAIQNFPWRIHAQRQHGRHSGNNRIQMRFVISGSRVSGYRMARRLLPEPHEKTVGAYPFNITGDSLRIKNNTDGGNASVIINKVSGTGTAGIVLQVDDTSQNDIYVEKGNPNTVLPGASIRIFPPSFFSARMRQVRSRMLYRLEL